MQRRSVRAALLCCAPFVGWAQAPPDGDEEADALRREAEALAAEEGPVARAAHRPAANALNPEISATADLAPGVSG